MSKPIRLTYKTTNWVEYNAALKRRGSLTIWFDPQMTWEGRPVAGPNSKARSPSHHHHTTENGHNYGKIQLKRNPYPARPSELTDEAKVVEAQAPSLEE